MNLLNRISSFVSRKTNAVLAVVYVYTTRFLFFTAVLVTSLGVVNAISIIYYSFVDNEYYSLLHRLVDDVHFYNTIQYYTAVIILKLFYFLFRGPNPPPPVDPDLFYQNNINPFDVFDDETKIEPPEVFQGPMEAPIPEAPGGNHEPNPLAEDPGPAKRRAAFFKLVQSCCLASGLICMFFFKNECSSILTYIFKE